MAVLLRRAEAGDVVVLDVRPAPEYAAGHLPGAGSIPLEELKDRLVELPEDLEVIAYCRGAYCALAHDAVRLLTADGRRARRATAASWNGGWPVCRCRLGPREPGHRICWACCRNGADMRAAAQPRLSAPPTPISPG